MRQLHQYGKLLVLGFVLVVHILVGYLARLFLQGENLRAFHISILQRNSRVCLAVLGITYTVEGDRHWRPGQAYLVVSNHLSYVDMLLLAAYKEVCFISTVEVRNTPFLGQLAQASGALFVERRSRENIREEINSIERILKGGTSISLFPEGTSTNGSSVLDFKRPLFAPAQRAGVPVLPVVIQPEEIDGQPFNASTRDHYCWYGDMDFTPHFFAMAGLRGLKLSLKILPEIPASEAVARDQLADQARDAIAQVYRPSSSIS